MSPCLWRGEDRRHPDSGYTERSRGPDTPARTDTARRVRRTSMVTLLGRGEVCFQFCQEKDKLKSLNYRQ